MPDENKTLRPTAAKGGGSPFRGPNLGGSWTWAVVLSLSICLPFVFLLVQHTMVTATSSECTAYTFLYGLRWVSADSVAPFQPHSQLLYWLYGPLAKLINFAARGDVSFFNYIDKLTVLMAMAYAVGAASLLYMSRRSEVAILRILFLLLIIDHYFIVISFVGALCASYPGVAVVAAMAALPLWQMTTDAPGGRRTALLTGAYVGLIFCIKFTFIVFAVPLLIVFSARNATRPLRLAIAFLAAALTILAIFLPFYHTVDSIATYAGSVSDLITSQMGWYPVDEPFGRWLLADAAGALPGGIVPIFAVSMVALLPVVIRHRRVLVWASLLGGFLLASWLFYNHAYQGMYSEYSASTILDTIVLYRFCLSHPHSSQQTERRWAALKHYVFLAVICVIPALSLLYAYEAYIKHISVFSEYNNAIKSYTLSGKETLVVQADNSVRVPGVPEILCKSSMSIFHHTYRSESITRLAPDFHCVEYGDHPNYDVSKMQRILFFAKEGESEADALARTTRYLPTLASVGLSCNFSVPLPDPEWYSNLSCHPATRSSPGDTGGTIVRLVSWLSTCGFDRPIIKGKVYGCDVTGPKPVPRD